MRPVQILLTISFLVSFTSWGQSKVKTYQLVFGIDTFKTTTILEPDPVVKKTIQEYSYLFKGSREIIKIPRRIDTVAVYTMASNPIKKRIRIDTVDRVVVNKIVDTICRSKLETIINGEIQIFSKGNKLKFDEAQFETIQSTGKSSYTIDLQKTRIREGKHAFVKISNLDKGGHLILKTIWFYDLRGDRQVIECNIAWSVDE